MLKLENLYKTYKDKKIFNHTDFEANKGEIVSVIGKSGIGKSTLLDIIAGIKQPDSGSYFYKGQLIDTKKDTQMSIFRNKKIGYILQDFALIDDYTVMENIMLPTLYNRNSNNNLEPKARELAYNFELTDILNKKVKNISGGQKQRVAIIRSILLNPRIILADEPTTNLDKENFELVVSILKKMKKRGKIIIIATHDERLFDISDKIYEINNYKLKLLNTSNS